MRAFPTNCRTEIKLFPNPKSYFKVFFRQWLNYLPIWVRFPWVYQCEDFEVFNSFQPPWQIHFENVYLMLKIVLYFLILRVWRSEKHLTCNLAQLLWKFRLPLKSSSQGAVNCHLNEAQMKSAGGAKNSYAYFMKRARKKKKNENKNCQPRELQT